jgi:pimeloyl-ACP methyl ester carboxylesterase
MQVVVDGLMTNYVKTGKGKTILFLHGWGDTSKSFSKMIEQLQANYQILALDLPGFGGTQAPENAWGLQDYAKFIQDWLKKIDAKDLYAVVGHSYGGAAAIMAVGEDLVKADKLILLASAGIRNKNQARKSLLKIVAKAAKVPLRLLPANKRRQIRQKAYGAIGSDLTLLPHMELTFKRIIGEDVQPWAHKLKLPTLLVYGTRDKDTPTNDGKVLQQAIEGSRLEVIDAGHFLHQEESQKVGGLVESFLDA